MLALYLAYIKPMGTKRNDKAKVNAILEEIILEKLRTKHRLSKDEYWFYLTGIMKISEEEAEKILVGKEKPFE